MRHYRYSICKWKFRLELSGTKRSIAKVNKLFFSDHLLNNQAYIDRKSPQTPPQDARKKFNNKPPSTSSLDLRIHDLESRKNDARNFRKFPDMTSPPAPVSKPIYPRRHSQAFRAILSPARLSSPRTSFGFLSLFSVAELEFLSSLR